MKSDIYKLTGVELFEWLTVKGCGKPIDSLGLVDETLDYLLDEVFSEIDDMIGKETNNTVGLTRSRKKTGLMGYSLGGLASCYAAWTRPDVGLISLEYFRTDHIIINA